MRTVAIEFPLDLILTSRARDGSAAPGTAVQSRRRRGDVAIMTVPQHPGCDTLPQAEAGACGTPPKRQR
jgi:hypothetical protein